MEFDQILQNSFVLDPTQGHGETLNWQRANKCPCTVNDNDSNRALFSCAVCGGVGWVYEAPVSLVAIITGVRNEKNLLDAGIIDIGDLLMGMAPAETHLISDWDLIQMTWPQGQPYEGDVRTRGDGPTDKLSYAPIQIYNCFAVDPVAGTIKPYVQGVDFTVSGRIITWIRDLPTGTRYSIKYTTNFVWVAFVTPADRYDKGVTIGQKVFLRKRHVVLPNA
jgi:hypothetical protein